MELSLYGTQKIKRNEVGGHYKKTDIENHVNLPKVSEKISLVGSFR